MGGKHTGGHSFLHGLLSAFVIFTSAFWPSPGSVKAAVPLDSLRDTINDTTPGKNNVQHDITFGLPANTVQVTPTDWLIIELTNYHNATAPTDITGTFGTPNYLVDDNTIKITNIAILPGASVEISGITATNPLSFQSFQIVVETSSTPDDSGVRNISTTLANQGGSLVSVSATVNNPLASVYLSGTTSPDSFLTLTSNGAVVGTTSAAADGTWAFSVGGLDTGNYDFVIGSTDTLNRATSLTTISLFLLRGTLTSATNIILSPTIELSTSGIQPGDTLTIFGRARPSSTINLFVESPLRNYAVTSDSSGDWTYTIPSSDTQNFVPGAYRTYANAQDDVGNLSIVSLSLNFTVNAPDSTASNPPPACNISHGDLNCDGKTNLTDFSILLFHWRTNHRVADINGDGTVNLVDFSIMMFYFKR